MSDLNEIVVKLRKMKMPCMADTLQAQMDNPNSDLRHFDDRIEEMVNNEWDTRYNKKLNRFLKNSSLRYLEATIDNSIYDPTRKLDAGVITELAKCEWIDEARNLLITGKASTGKSYLSCALGVCAIRQFKSVKYVKSSHLISALAKAEMDGLLIEETKKLAEYKLLIIDDFGLMDLDTEKCRNMFEVLDSREMSGSTIVISQIPINKWHALFKDATYADACMERLIRRAYRLEMNGRNMREGL